MHEFNSKFQIDSCTRDPRIITRYNFLLNAFEHLNNLVDDLTLENANLLEIANHYEKIIDNIRSYIKKELYEELSDYDLEQLYNILNDDNYD